MELKNDFFRAEFNTTTGALTALRTPNSTISLIEQIAVGYHYEGVEYSERADERNACSFAVEFLESSANSVRSTLSTPHVEIHRSFTCNAHSPFLKISLEICGRKAGVEIQQSRFPYVKFAEDFLSVIEGDERDRFFDGAELGEGRELPPWRVFFRPGHNDGVLLATRSKLMMSHIQIWPRTEKAFECRPHLMCSYSSDYEMCNRPLRLEADAEYSMEFEIGPWSAARHEALIEAARLDQPLQLRKPPPPRQRLAPNLKGKVFAAADVIAPENVSDQYAPDKWLLTDEANSHYNRALFANDGCRPPLLEFDPQLSGLHHVYIGTGTGSRAYLKLRDEPYPRYRHNGDYFKFFLPWELHLGSTHQPNEIDFGVADITGQTLQWGAPPSQQIPAMLDYIRFEPLDEAEAQNYRERCAVKPVIPLSGFADTYDIGYAWGDALDPSTLPYRANIWAHAQAGFERIFWRIDGEVSDFPTRSGTMRPISCWSHNCYEPHAKAYSLMLRRHDLLRAAIETGRECGIEIWGWMRFNSYFSGARSEFFLQHPEYWDYSESGTPFDFRLSLAFEEVRRHKIDILVEAARYGLPGLNLGFLRHPPILYYHPTLVESYRRRYGVDPPRDLTPDFFAHLMTLPESSPEHERWYRHRAEHMTLFGRELRAALAAENLNDVKVSIWVRPNHCLFDGIDLDIWLDEKLCDEVVAGPYAGDLKLLMAEPQWKERVQSRVPLIGGINPISSLFETPGDVVRAECERYVREGYDGICTYESNDAVVMPEMLDLYQSLRR